MEIDNRSPMQRLIGLDGAIVKNPPLGISEKEYTETIKQYKLGSLRLYFRMSYNLLLKMVDNFISEINSEYFLKVHPTRNNRIIGDEIKDWISLILFDEIERDNDFKHTLKELENITLGTDGLEYGKKTIQFLLQNNLEKYFQLIRTFSVLFVPNKSQQKVMQKLNIYKKYKPAGNKLSKEIRKIFFNIPSIQEELIQEYGGIKKGKSDLKSAVKRTIKFLENKKSIPKYKYDPEKVYDTFLKYDPDKVYQNLINDGKKALMNRIMKKNNSDK